MRQLLIASLIDMWIDLRCVDVMGGLMGVDRVIRVAETLRYQGLRGPRAADGRIRVQYEYSPAAYRTGTVELLCTLTLQGTYRYRTVQRCR